MFVNIFFTSKCAVSSFIFCSSSFFLFYLITNNPRKLEVVESNLIMENFSSSLSLSVCLCVCLCVLVGVSFLLSLTLLLMPHFSGCYVT